MTSVLRSIDRFVFVYDLFCPFFALLTTLLRIYQRRLDGGRQRLSGELICGEHEHSQDFFVHF